MRKAIDGLGGYRANRDLGPDVFSGASSGSAKR